MKQLQVLDRVSGQLEIEEVYGDQALQLVYGDTALARCLGPLLLPLVRTAWLSKLFGYWQNTQASRKRIRPFIEQFKVDTDEFLQPVDSFATFNEFFYRKLKPTVRPITPGDDVAIVPADGRFLVYPNISKNQGFLVKGQKLDLDQLLQDPQLARDYQGGSLVLGRLCPTDYHRYHFPCRGTADQSHLINGWLYSVNPIATRKRPSIFVENKRVLTKIQSPEFGQVLMIEVGATFVGSILQTYQPNEPISKGAEKGYFAFGGSAIILLFQPDRIQFAEDLVSASEQGLEAKCQLGQALGTTPKSAL